MQISDKGLQFIKDVEGVVLHIYHDQAGLETIGVGHLLTSSEKATGVINIKGNKVIAANGITAQQALDLLAQDVAPAVSAVYSAVKVPINQNQVDALTSFAFNVGTNGMRSSTAIAMLNAGKFDQVGPWLAKWDKAGGKVCSDLVERRAKEIALFYA